MTHVFATRGPRYGAREYPPRFKPMNKPPVKGGRWGVRKRLDGRWVAWTHGKARKYQAIFMTHHYAFAWAEFVTQAYGEYEGNWPGIGDYMKHVRGQFKRNDLIYFVNEKGGVVTSSAIASFVGDPRRGLGLSLARQSSINESLRGR